MFCRLKRNLRALQVSNNVYEASGLLAMANELRVVGKINSNFKLTECCRLVVNSNRSDIGFEVQY